MKKYIVIILILVMLFTFGCQSENKKNQEEVKKDVSSDVKDDNESKEEGKDMVIAVNADIISLDPHNISDTLSGSASRTMYETLYSYKKDMSLEPKLATEYSVSDDGLVYTFKLREGVKFHDGTDFNAEAVDYNFKRILNEENNLRRRRNFTQVESTKVVDKYTIEIKLKDRFAPMINRIASLSIISPAALEKHGAEGIITNPVGTGPYIFKEWTPGDKMVVEVNPNYWQDGPKIKTLSFKPVTENGARIAMLQTGEADFIYPMPTEQVSKVENDKNIEVIKGPSTIARFTFINMTKDVFKNVKVRQAMNHAIDKEAYAKIVKSGYAVPLTSHVPSTIEYQTAQKEYDFDIDKAKKLMEEAGYKDGFEAHIWAPNDTENMKGMQFISQSLEKIGIKLEVIPMEEGTLSDSIYKAKTPEESTVNMWYVSWSAYDIDGATSRLFHSENIPPVAPNVSYYMNPEADKLIEAGASEVDPAKRTKIYNDLQKVIWDDAPWLFLGSDVLLSAKRTTTEGIVVLPSGGIDAGMASTTK